MNAQKIIEKLKQQYPGKAVICLPEENPSEIICELEPTSEHSEKSIALAVVGKSALHYHKQSTEIYEVLRGVLTLSIDGIEHILKEGERITINPGQVHSAKGIEVWFLTYGEPGWTPEDHILV